jgi:L-fuculose-phosphate aldolase
MISRWQNHKRSVAETARKMAELGLVVGTAGNVSVRLDSESGRELMAVTPSGTSYDGLTQDDVVVTDFEIEPVEGDLPPSSESLLHSGIYRRRPDVHAIVHTHAIYSSVLAVSGIDLPPVIDEVVVYVGGAIEVSRYGFPGTPELADNVCDALGHNKAAFIANHGAVTVGETLEEALSICRLVERASQIYIMARSLGQVTPIPTEFVTAETAIYRMKNPQIGAVGSW